MSLRRLLILTGSFSLVHAASAISVDISAINDTTLYSESGNQSNGGGDHIFAGRTVQSDNRRALIRFDISSLVPAGATINSATLNLTLNRTVTGAIDVSLHTLTGDWGEGTADAPDPEGLGTTANPGDATWTSDFLGTSTWTTPGGDFNALASATTSVAGTGSYSWSSGALAADVQSFLDSPASNFGWILIGDESTISAKRFASSTNGTVGDRPLLTVDYTPVPEPTTYATLFGLLALGFVSLKRRD